MALLEKIVSNLKNDGPAILKLLETEPSDRKNNYTFTVLNEDQGINGLDFVCSKDQNDVLTVLKVPKLNQTDFSCFS